MTGKDCQWWKHWQHDLSACTATLGRVGRKIVKMHTTNIVYKGYTHRASEDGPESKIKSDKTDHIAMPKDTALKANN